ncbi:MAG TPA: enoyl-CoA hydratase [Steroidobacteraceae bacterium]|nr:enoyl-CoA hydratase [Steroidobacteraceae bacterium]
MSGAPHFLGRVEGGIAWATLNRPDAMNAFSPEMREDLIEFLMRVEHDSEVRCVVLAGSGENFMAGGDVKSFTADLAQGPEQRRSFFERTCHAMHPIIYLIRRMPKPVIASVQGACAGLGTSFVLACDLAIAADNAFFTLAYVKIGTTPDGGASFFLPRTVGMKRAMEIALLSERLDAATAERHGLINRVVPADNLAAETFTMASRLASGATQALGRTKALLSSALERDLESHLQQEALNFAASTMTSDMIEGVTAFVEKRRPKFENR